ncbi:MAG: twin-arginine translocation signal domain-containing protein [Betaproteobacteria bacterium]|nr:twin-arginine translocation signal domain-containing protein [Betaproteobacteria bacterium]
MTTEITRRDFLKASGSLLVTVGATGAMQSAFVEEAAAQAATFASPSPETFSSWLTIGKDGKILVFSGKVDHGQGLGTAFRQIVAEELDVPLSRVAILFGDTVLTANQGGARGSTGIRAGGKPIRNIAAEARRVLVSAGAARFGVPFEAMTAQNGVVFVTADPAKRVTYEDLIAVGALTGKLTWNKAIGNDWHGRKR